MAGDIRVSAPFFTWEETAIEWGAPVSKIRYGAGLSGQDLVSPSTEPSATVERKWEAWHGHHLPHPSLSSFPPSAWAVKNI